MVRVDEKAAGRPGRVRDEDITPEHRAWMNARTREALDRKQSGKASYRSLDDVRRDFGF